MSDLNGKKLLILGGSYVDRKLIHAAKRLGVVTYITDITSIARSPAKLIADHSYTINSSDVDSILCLCRCEKIDGVLSLYHDFSQTSYRIICEKLGLPHFGNEEQHRILTNKKFFKRFCDESGLGTIPYYNSKDKNISYPVIVKPLDGRGSKGQTICNSPDELNSAIDFAKSYSRYDDVIIEKYLGNKNDLELAYLVINGEPILQKFGDRFLGDEKNNLDKLCIASIYPSKHEKFYRETNNSNVMESLKNLKLENSPIFLQGFMYEGKAMFYDPGIRLPGDDYDVGYKSVTGIDIAELFIYFALTGNIPNHFADEIKNARLNKWIAMILPCVRPGKIASIKGLDKIDNNESIVSWASFYREGDEVGVFNDSRQRFAEFIIVTSTIDQLKNTVKWIFDTVKVLGEGGEDMMIEKFDVSNLNSYSDDMIRVARGGGILVLYIISLFYALKSVFLYRLLRRFLLLSIK